MHTALLITIYNRPEYVRKCLQSIGRCFIPDGLKIYLIDDCSDSADVIKACAELTEHTGISGIVEYRRNDRNLGIKESLKRNIDQIIEDGAGVIINLDSDSVVKPNFLMEILSLKRKHPNNIVSGFNHVSDRNPNVFEKKDHVLKRLCNGINMCFNKQQYQDYIRPALQIGGNWDYNVSQKCVVDGNMIVVTKPSVVQHIGYDSSMGHGKYGFDYAQDFKMIKLPDVTLFGIDAHDPKGIIRASHISQRDIEFGSVNIITERKFPGSNREEGRENYSKFMIKDLDAQFSTSHVLTIHADGYVINWEAWDNDWLQYDYIGATWDWYNENMVGNGGFSLRSKKLTSALAKDTYIKEFHPEDDKICRKYRKYLEKNYDIKFAPVEVAKKFSIEGWGLKEEYQKYGNEFGFHNYNLNFEGSWVPRVFWPKDIVSKGGEIFDLSPEEAARFPNFIPERFRPPKLQVKPIEVTPEITSLTYWLAIDYARKGRMICRPGMAWWRIDKGATNQFKNADKAQNDWMASAVMPDIKITK